MSTGRQLFVAMSAALIFTGCTALGHETQAVPAQARAAHAHYVSTQDLDLRRILAPPPAADSAVTRAELDLMLKIQAERTRAEVERARADVAIDSYRFADALGNSPAFAAGKLPRTDLLFKRVLEDETAISEVGKTEFARLRPFLVEPRLETCVPRPRSSSYPSGHSTWAFVTALVLADMVPERREQILARAEEFAHNRVLCGVHFPSDVEGGKLTGTALAALLFNSPAFHVDELDAATELRAALGLPASAALH